MKSFKPLSHNRLHAFRRQQMQFDNFEHFNKEDLTPSIPLHIITLRSVASESLRTQKTVTLQQYITTRSNFFEIAIDVPEITSRVENHCYSLLVRNLHKVLSDNTWYFGDKRCFSYIDIL